MKKLFILTLTMIIAASTIQLEAVVVVADPRIGVDPYARAAVATPRVAVVGAPVARAAVVTPGVAVVETPAERRARLRARRLAVATPAVVGAPVARAVATPAVVVA